MKKTYTKPEISFESFLMSTNIAGDCEIRANTNTNYNTCGHVYGDKILFGTDLGGCLRYEGKNQLINPGSGLTNDSFCYHTPTEASNIFNS
ncbi:MAG: hypothetical protein E7469_07270 [Ruminococcaceae bacterium]|nr:hypothetical protein [Oscillospiraceae bacterium]